VSRPLIYMAHPVAPTAEEIASFYAHTLTSPTRPAELALQANLQAALRCLAWLRASFPETAFVAPWISTIESLNGDDSPALREAVLVDVCAVVERCDGIVLCGGRISSGMRREMEHGLMVDGVTTSFVAFEGFDVYDLTGQIDPEYRHVITGMTFIEHVASIRSREAVSTEREPYGCERATGRCIVKGEAYGCELATGRHIVKGVSTECLECTLCDAAVEMPCAKHVPDALRAERDRRFGLVIAGLPTGMKRKDLQRRGKWRAW
jgi:hypothetical protein